jgi:branched-subunit amino acid transport protein
MNIVWLALGMALVTYPSRALPWMSRVVERMPESVIRYLRLVAPSVLGALAAINAVTTQHTGRHNTFTLGLLSLGVAIAVIVVAWRRNVLLGLLCGVAVVALLRGVGL